MKATDKILTGEHTLVNYDGKACPCEYLVFNGFIPTVVNKNAIVLNAEFKNSMTNRAEHERSKYPFWLNELFNTGCLKIETFGDEYFKLVLTNSNGNNQTIDNSPIDCSVIARIKTEQGQKFVAFPTITWMSNYESVGGFDVKNLLNAKED